MALIVENGTGLLNANSYASLADAAAYFGVRKNLDWFGGAVAQATGTLTATGSPVAGDTVTIGTQTYIFKLALTDPAVEDEVLLGQSTAESMENLYSAIENSLGAGTVFSTGTKPNKSAVVTNLESNSLTVAAVAYGTVGNGVATTTTGTALSWGAATLTGGTQTIPQADQEAALVQATAYIDARYGLNFRGTLLNSDQALAFPRYGIRAGCLRGQLLPPDLLKATSEYALRALTAPLAPDLTSDPTGYMVASVSKKVGPLGGATQYATGTGVNVRPSRWKIYPVPDALMQCMLINTTGAAQSRVVRG